MKFWFVSHSGEPLPDIDEGQRVMRLGLLGAQLIRLGHQVTWWTSDFVHSTKKHRFHGRKSLKTVNGWQFELFKGRGYKNNFSYQRVLHNRNLANQFTAGASEAEAPDLILSPLPAPEVTAAAIRYGLTHSIPVVVDVRDLWPLAIIELFPRILQPVARRLLSGMEDDVRYSCKNASAIVAMSSEFVDWGISKAGRSRSEWDRVFRHAYDVRGKTADEPGRLLNEVRKSIKGRFVILFTGTLGASVDFETVIKCAHELEQKELPVAWIVVGDGPHYQKWRQRTKNLKWMFWTGRVGKKEVQEALSMAQAGLVPYRTTENLRIGMPNKIGEYLSAAMPILNGVEGSVANLVKSHGVGVNYCHWDSSDLAQAVNGLIQNNEKYEAMRVAARRLFSSEFSARKVYQEYAGHLLKIAECSD